MDWNWYEDRIGINQWMAYVEVEVKNRDDENIYYCHNPSPIFIITKWTADEFGGPARHDETICLTYGSGIDISLLGLKKTKPEPIPGRPE